MMDEKFSLESDDSLHPNVVPENKIPSFTISGKRGTFTIKSE
jgi:hypothetical protein